MRIEVTFDDISSGEVCDGFRCPLALAINRATGRTAFVTHTDVAFADSVTRLFPLPVEASHWVREFDRLRLATPFGFELDLEFPAK